MKYSHHRTKYIGKQVGLRTYQQPGTTLTWWWPSRSKHALNYFKNRRQLNCSLIILKSIKLSFQRTNVQGKSVPVLKWAPCHEGRGCTAPCILNFSTRQRWMVSFAPNKIASSNNQLGGWIEQKAGLDVLEKWQIPALSRNHTRIPLLSSLVKRLVYCTE